MKHTKLKNILIIIVLLLLFIYDANGIIENLQVSNNSTPKIYLPIIMYHHVKNTQLGKDAISQSEFESDLRFLSENNYNTITISQLIDYVYDDKQLPPKPIILSFDDGLLSTYVNVYPLLKKYDMQIVLSIVGKSTEIFSNTVDINMDYSHITWNQLKEMAQSGLVEIQNHSYDMHSINNKRYGCSQMKNEEVKDYENYITEDVTIFNEKIKFATNSIPNTFTYPYGKYNENTETILKKLGFKATISCKFGVNLISKNKDCLYELKRICRSHNQSIEKMIKEGMKTINN